MEMMAVVATMNVALSSLALAAAGSLAGYLAFDERRRRRDADELTITRDEFRASIAKISDVHNSLASTVQMVQDQVAQHEFKLSGRAHSSTQRPG